ncbi:hypothetical protein IIA15_02495, partial [candidate division TA06 bacterium]|nr:hypothetical protein [candidate division TA06 bacterium]
LDTIPPTLPNFFPIVQVRSTARRGGMERTIVVETTMKKTNPEVEGSLNFGGNAEFTGSPITFYANGAVSNYGTTTPLIKRETTSPFDIYVDKDEDNIFDRFKVKTDSTEWGFYATWATGPDSGREYKWNLDRLPFDARIDQFGAVGTDWEDYPKVSINFSEFTEEGDLIANGNIIFYETPRIHGEVKAHGEVSLTEDTLSYVTGEILTEQPPKALLVVDFEDTVRWRDDLGYDIVYTGDLGISPFEKWELDNGDAHYRGGISDTFEGKYYFADSMDVVIDSILLGVVYITTPGNVTIYNDLTVPFELNSILESSLIIAQYNITLANDSLFVRAGLQSQLGNLVVEGKNPVIHGYVMVGGNGTIDKDLVIVLLDVYRDPSFSQWELFKKRNLYNITTLSWREMN